ncbi:hypothetical protein GW17_00030854 [Ensete ventricosum]|nr:hypothetical protein GW17_00030854 [Ensete ventricosum]
MVSLISSSSASSSSSSVVSLPPAEEVRSSGFAEVSLSSGTLTSRDVRALKALKVMNLCHDCDSVLSVELLSTVREHYSIPSEYTLHAPASRQRPYDSFPDGFSISTDNLEARLRFPLHPVIEECLGWCRTSPSQMASNSWRYLITFLGECRGAGIIQSRLSCFRLCKGQDGYHLTARSRFKVGGAPSNNKGWKAQYLPKLVRELCYARLGVDGRDYHVVRMSNLPEHDPDAPLEMHLSPLTHGTRIWQDRAASTKYAPKVQIPRLAADLYTMPSKVLIDRVAKTMVLVRLVSSFLCFLFVCIDTRPLPSQSQHYHMALIDWAHDVGRVISAMDNKADGLRKEIQELKVGAGSEAQSLADHYKIELEEATR